MSQFRILALGGDGIGPEVLEAALRVVDRVATDAELEVEISRDLLHGACWEAHGTFCRDETVAAAKAADAVLVSAVGGPKWDGIRVAGGPERQDGLMRLRWELDAFAGLRPARAWPALAEQTPFRPGLAERADILVLREMCGGAMFATPRGRSVRNGGRYAYDTAAYGEAEIVRVVRAAFELARRRSGRLVSADKANVMESYALWREVAGEVAAGYPDVTFTHMYADNCAYQMMRAPAAFDVIVADNLIGDFLSDLAAVVSGALGLLPSACLTGIPEPGRRCLGIFEPVHGSAPDIAGQGIANPIGMILSAAMMFEYAFARADLARRIEAAVERTLARGVLTPDLVGKEGIGVSTTDVTDCVLGELAK